MRMILSATLVMIAGTVWADGFAVTDFNHVTVDDTVFTQGSYGHSKEAERITVHCESCDDVTTVSVALSRSTDGTEGRFRSGETTIKKMEEICQQRDPECTLERLDVGAAVGWVTQYKLGSSEGSTGVLFQDGDVLVIRSLSDIRARARRNMATVLRHIAPQIVGN